ncbi:MAG: DNA repair protein RecN [Acidimicrobiales bacterium]
MSVELVELRVRNLGVIEDVTLRPGSGMTALTGETGAGKTLLVGALSLLLGGRLDPTSVRAGAEEATVEARFATTGPIDRGHLDASDRTGDHGQLPLQEDGEMLLARSLPRTGRSRAWIDGRMATIGSLTEVASGLLELHGQHQHQYLVHPGAQRRVLDSFGAIDLGPVGRARRHLRGLIAELESLGGDSGRRTVEADLLRYQMEEIEAAAIEDAEEDQRLAAEEERLADAVAHRESAAGALDAVSGSEGSSALDRLAEASRMLSGRPALAGLDARVRAAMADLSDLALELRKVSETWEDDPQGLETIRSRRRRLSDLIRKHGPGLEDVLRSGADARERLAAISADQQRVDGLESEIREAAERLASCEAEVALARRETAPRFAIQVQSTLRQLAMPDARFAVEVEGDRAAEQVTFLLGPNAGEPLQPLAKVASGGELARTMLAVRLTAGDGSRVVAFDEVDAGVGGRAALAVGAALAELGRSGQVLVVTHLAQVAAQAGTHIEVHKTERAGRTVSEALVLDGDRRVVEVARMLSGRPDSASAHHHARELLAAHHPVAGQ